MRHREEHSGRGGVTGDKIYCVYVAPDEQTVRQHAKQGGFPADQVSKVVTMIDLTTAE